MNGLHISSSISKSDRVAEQTAITLTNFFYEHGNFLAAAAAGRGASLPSLTAANLAPGAFVPSLDEIGFDGLAVQAVAFEKGSKAPQVHIYLAKGSKKGIHEIPIQDEVVQIHVQRIGKVQINPQQANTSTSRPHIFIRKKRIACGSSCAPTGENYAGTFGAIVKKQGSTDFFALSNNHVFGACNHTSVGQPIMAPADQDAGAKTIAPIEIGRHAEICELRSGEPALVNPCLEDVALARARPDAISSWQGDDVDGYDTPSRIVPLVSGMQVKKFGRTTGLTLGRTEAELTLTPIPFKSKHFNATVYFKDVWSVRSNDGDSFALPGDSGSLVVTEDGKAAVGLVFACHLVEGYALIVPMTRIAQCFPGLSLVSNHGV